MLFHRLTDGVCMLVCCLGGTVTAHFCQTTFANRRIYLLPILPNPLCQANFAKAKSCLYNFLPQFLCHFKVLPKTFYFFIFAKLFWRDNAPIVARPPGNTVVALIDFRPNILKPNFSFLNLNVTCRIQKL